MTKERDDFMVQCAYCDSKLENNVSICPHCGAPVPVTAEPEQTSTYGNDTYEGSSDGSDTYESDTNQGLDAAKTVAKIAGAAIGTSLLNGLFGGRRRYPSAPPNPPKHGGMMGGFGSGSRPMGGSMGHGSGPRPMGGPGGHGGRPMGGRGGAGGHGGGRMGGPGGPRH